MFIAPGAMVASDRHLHKPERIEQLGARPLDLMSLCPAFADLRRAILHETSLRDAQLNGADFWNADLDRIDLHNAIFSETNLEEAIMEKSFII